MSRHKSAKPGDIVHVQFFDHVEDGSEPFVCNVYGRVAISTPLYYCIDSWTVDPIPQATCDSNTKRFTILKSTLVKVVIYESYTKHQS